MRSTKRRAFFTRRGPAPKETVIWGMRGYMPRDLWALFGLLPGMTILTRRHTEQRPLTNEDYNA